jgi:predicted  nucleic acid-binding Zn-ribbon protein
MNKHLLHLVKLSRIDDELNKIGKEIEEDKSEMKVLQIKQDRINREIIKEQGDLQNSTINKNKNFLSIQEFSDKLESIKEKQKNIKTERELKSLSVEESIAKEQITHANNQIEVLENKEKDHQDKLVELKDAHEQIEKEIEKEDKVLTKKVKKITRSSKAIYKSQEKVKKEVDDKIYSFYTKIKKWAKNASVVPIEDKVCTGCQMELNDKTYLEVLKKENVVTCCNCGRIVFDDNIVTEEETA